MCYEQKNHAKSKVPERTFNAKIPMERFVCHECGKETPLKDLVRAYTTCQCGQRSRYLTNETAWGFDINCINCGGPVPLEYVPGKDLYATIGSHASKSKKRRKG